MKVNPFFFVSLFFFFFTQESTENVQAEGASANHSNVAMQSPHKVVRAKHSRARGCVHICVCVYVNQARAHAREFALTRYVYAYTCRNVRPHGSPAYTSGETCERREAGAPRAIGHLTSMAVPLFLTNTIVQYQRYHDLRRCLHV